ncbi:MAG: hypothetical protein ABI663_17225 [Chryseolinea sp.]
MKRIHQFCFILLSIVFFRCEPEPDLARQFVIEKGEHYATPRLVETLQSNRLTFTAKFGPSCQYTFVETGFQDSKNKLLGFADCNSLHHENSARFAWQWLHDRLEIFAYCYVDGARVEQFITVVELNQENQYEIQLLEDAYMFSVNNQEPIKIERGTACRTGVYYTLWPYFGGTLPAPHDIHLAIQIQY